MPTVPDNASTLIMSKSGANTIGRRADTLAQVVSSASSATAFNSAFAWLVNNIGAAAPKGMRIEPDTYTLTSPIQFGTNINGAPISNFFMYGNLAQPNTSIIFRCGTADIFMFRKPSSSAFSRDIRLLNFTIDGATISQRVISFEHIDGILIQNVIFERSNNAADPQPSIHGSGPCVYLEGANYTVESCISRNHTGSGDALAVGGTNIFIFRNELYGTVAQNGSITSGGIIHGEIAYNDIHNKWTYGGVSIENQTRRTENLRIHDNTFTNINNQGIAGQQSGNAIMFISSSDGLPEYDHKGIEIDHNTFLNIRGCAIKLGAVDSGGADRPFTFLKLHDNRMTNITVSPGDAIRIGPVKSAVIENNEIDNADGWAIRFRSPEDGIVSDDIQILDNIITNIGAGTYFTAGCTNVIRSGNSPP